ncbi:hypothetical protein V494_02961 [Pseudogymnoascus sp. VKM F-4513 (FW-928)]|nr:hypothetical protein V494_02961 [Pseudogymnoascus sp. VKM F-4513 (FW-928)]
MLNETPNERLNEMLGKDDALAFGDRMIYDEEAPQQEYSVTNLPGELQILCNGEALQQYYNFPTRLQTPYDDGAFQQYYNFPTELQTPCDDEALQQYYSINFPFQLQTPCDDGALQQYYNFPTRLQTPYDDGALQQYYNFPTELQTPCDDGALQQYYNFSTELHTPCDDEALQQYYSINFPFQLQTACNDYNINNGLPAQPQTLCDEEALPKATATSLFPTTNSEFRNGEGNRIRADSQSDDPAFIEKIRKERDQWMTLVGTKMGRYGGW